jgi:putative phosphoesterase
VRGNCDAEVDQMVLDFPITADFRRIEADGLKIFLTHGHVYDMNSENVYEKGEILLHGHTHLLTSVTFGDGNVYINPGSVSIPKGGNPKSFILYSDRTFTTVTPDGVVISKVEF